MIKIIIQLGDLLEMYLDKKIETGVKINSELRRNILELEKNFEYWENKGSYFQKQLIENIEKIQSLSEELESEIKLYRMREEHDRKIKIRQIENRIAKLKKRNQQTQDKVKKFEDKIENGKIVIERLYITFSLDYYIKLHQKLWEIRMKSLKSDKPETDKINNLLKEIDNNPMFQDVENYLVILDQEGIYEHFKKVKLDRFKP